jgi:beta-lactamase regulating signal transducer with metallopeptidase domain
MMLDLHAIAQMSALRIVDCLVEGTLITIFASLLLGIARRQNSATRFATWFSVLIAIAVLPLLGGLAWSQRTGLPAATLSKSVITLPVSWTLYLFATWAVIAGWSLLGVGRGLWHLHVLRKTCIPIDPALLDARLHETLGRNQSSRAVALCTSDRVQVPTAIGLVNPAVVIPGWVMQELSTDELNQILLHELAHLRRWDDWTNLMQKVVKALFFFHPAVWWIEKRVSLEREMACDDAVLAETASPRAYAECLAHLAEKTLIQRSVALAQAALGRIRQTSLRVAQILDVNRPTGTGRSWKPAVSLVVAFAVVSVLGISRAPRLIAFSDDPSRASAPAIASISPSLGSGKAATAVSAAEVSAANVSATQAMMYERPARIVQASLNLRETPHKLQNSARAVAMQSPTSEPRTGSMVHENDADQNNAHPNNARQIDARQINVRLTNANAAPVAFTETLFVVVEGRELGFPDQPVYQVQLWRLVVLHPVVDPNNNRIPAKQT